MFKCGKSNQLPFSWLKILWKVHSHFVLAEIRSNAHNNISTIDFGRANAKIGQNYWIKMPSDLFSDEI
jgi:hypothetical protein